MRIGFDARFLTHPQHGGFKSYVENLVAALARVDNVNEYLLYTDRPSNGVRLPDKPNFTVKLVPGTLPIVGMPYREQITLPGQIARDGVDLAHYPSLTAPIFSPVPYVVSMFDTIWLKSPVPTNVLRWLRAPSRMLMQAYYRFVPLRAARQARLLLADSQAARDDVIKDLGVSEARVRVTYLAVSPSFQPIEDRGEIARFRQKHQLPERFILGIGSADPRKNMERLVQAYAQLPEGIRHEYHLVILWTHHLLKGEVMDLTQRLHIQDKVHFLIHISPEDLVRLYNAATLFAFVSLQEGFGFPPLEAMACGTPIIAPDNSSMPEVLGNVTLMVDVRDSAAIAGAIARVLSDETLRAELIAKGLKRAAGFSWDKCARETVDAYAQALDQ